MTRLRPGANRSDLGPVAGIQAPTATTVVLKPSQPDPRVLNRPAAV